MIGLAILAIVLALGMPSYGVWIQNTKIRNAAESILDGLQLTRSEAVARNSNVQFTLGAGSSWTICLLSGDVCAQTIQSRATGQGSSSSVMVTTTPANQTKIVFNSLGRAEAATGGLAVSQIDVDIDPAILPASESRNLRIMISGGARMCDPTVSAPDSRAC